MFKSLFPASLCALFFVACTNNSSSNTDPANSESGGIVMHDMHNAENSLDVAGVYTGVLPCADCEGIETTLTLYEDGTFDKRSNYLERKGSDELKENGTWAIHQNTVTLSGLNNGPKEYLARENALTELDMDGNKIEGALAKYYVLKKAGM